MGARTWMLVGANGNARELLAGYPMLDREATRRLADRLFPREKLQPLDDGDLSYTCPPDDELDIGCFPGLAIVAANEFGIDYPSTLEPRFLREIPNRNVYLHAMHSVVDWFAFAVWQDGQLKRSLSLSPDSGVLEDIGPRLPFELPYWAGEHPVDDPDDKNMPPYPFPFHPLELGEAALREFFGYQIEGYIDDSLLDAEKVPLARFKRKSSWFKRHIWRTFRTNE